MINTQDLEKLLSLSFYSSYVKGDKAISLMIVSDRPESGKSEIAMKFLKNRGIRMLSDVTAYALWRDMKEDIENGNIKHIVIPEFLAPLSRKSETVASFISTLQMLIEEGIMEIHTGFLKPMQLHSPASIGAVVCMPRNAFQSRKLEWELSGFLSRFLVVSYKYDNETIRQIFHSIANLDYREDNHDIKLVLPDEPVEVAIPVAIRNKTEEYVFEQTEALRKSGRGYGYRNFKNMIRLMGANVLYENGLSGESRKQINDTDFEEVKRLSYLINEEFNALKSSEA